MKKLLEPYQLNYKIHLKNRILMAPMTRNMADDDLCPTTAMVDYYQRRAAAGLIITEGTIIRPDARGYSHVPGIFTPKQIKGWQRVTEAVHQQGGHIFQQIWHVGRVSHPDFLDGALPIAPSATKMSSRVARTQDRYYDQSRAATLEEISGLVTSFAVAAENAIKAGFDGIEIHGANGYLIDQFLHYDTNHREDAYGASPENMARFALEVVRACGETIGYERVGLRLSPGAYLNEIVGHVDDGDVFKYLLEQLNQYPIAYVHTGSFNDTLTYSELDNKTMTDFIRNYYRSNVVACGGYTFATAQQGIEESKFDLVALGRPFIANPNLISLLEGESELQGYDASMLTTLM